MKRILTVCLAALVLAAPSRADVTFDELFHLTPDAAERSLGVQRVKVLKAALEDFNAVLNYKPPTHAIFDKDAPLAADGGTSNYKAPGYQLTIFKSLFSFGDRPDLTVHGYMYGPALTPGPELGVGNYSTFSRVSFYPLETLNKLLK